MTNTHTTPPFPPDGRRLWLPTDGASAIAQPK